MARWIAVTIALALLLGPAGCFLRAEWNARTGTSVLVILRSNPGISLSPAKPPGSLFWGRFQLGRIDAV